MNPKNKKQGMAKKMPRPTQTAGVLDAVMNLFNPQVDTESLTQPAPELQKPNTQTGYQTYNPSGPVPSETTTLSPQGYQSVTLPAGVGPTGRTPIPLIDTMFPDDAYNKYTEGFGGRLSDIADNQDIKADLNYAKGIFRVPNQYIQGYSIEHGPYADVNYTLATTTPRRSRILKDAAILGDVSYPFEYLPQEVDEKGQPLPKKLTPKSQAMYDKMYRNPTDFARAVAQDFREEEDSAPYSGIIYAGPGSDRGILAPNNELYYYTDQYGNTNPYQTWDVSRAIDRIRKFGGYPTR